MAQLDDAEPGLCSAKYFLAIRAHERRNERVRIRLPCLNPNQNRLKYKFASSNGSNSVNSQARRFRQPKSREYG